jgi:hypothetical protein
MRSHKVGEPSRSTVLSLVRSSRRRKRQLLGAEEIEIMAQVAEAGVQIVRQAAAGDPLSEAMQIAPVGQERIAGQTAFGVDVATKRLNVVHESGVVLETFGRHGVPPCWCCRPWRDRFLN